jgi:hypothetical protein
MSAAVVIGDSFHLMNMPVVLTAQQRIAWGTRRIAVSTHYVAANSAVHIKYLVTPAVPAVAGAAVPCFYSDAQLTAAGAVGSLRLGVWWVMPAGLVRKIARPNL